MEETPMTVTIKTKAINGDNGVTTLKNRKINTVTINEVVWDDTWNPIAQGACTTNSKMFVVVPATVVATVTSSNNTQTKLNLFVDKWSNENALWNDHDNATSW